MKTGVLPGSLLVIWGLISCSSLPPASPEVFQKVNGYHGLTLEDFRSDRSLYVNRCGGCHALPLPRVFARKDGNDLLTRMSAMAKLSPGEKLRLERYVGAMRDLSPDSE